MKFAKQLVLAAMCSTAMNVPAFAQDGETEGADDDVIIVTAQKRTQDVQDVPIAVTAVSPVELQRQGVVNVAQLTQVSASFSSSNTQLASSGTVLRIRGIGTTSNNIGFESAVGIFVDGVYQSRSGVALSEFVDVERVEVLRGPQGTLFGRNTSAGALNVTNKRPDVSEFGGFVNASYGNYDLVSVQGAVNIPIVQDSLALRVTGAYRERDGFVDIVDGTGAKIGESNTIDQYLVRGQIGYEGDGIDVRIIGDFSKNTANCCSAVELLASPLEVGGAFQGVGLGPRGGMAAPVRATNAFDVTTGERAAENRIATASFVPTANVEQWGVSAEVTFPLGDAADIIYIGSYREYDASETFDPDFSGLDILASAPSSDTSIDTMTHELRIQGEAFGGALEWMVGGFYSEEDIVQTAALGIGPDYDRLAGALLLGLSPQAFQQFGPLPLTRLSGGNNPANILTANRYAQNSKSWSLFTHNTLEVTDGLKLTVGLRYSDESKDGSYSQPNSVNATCSGIANNFANIPASLRGLALSLGCFPPAATADLPQSAFLPIPRTFNSKFKDDEFIYTGKISYEFADPVTVYASFTHGYKSGGFNLDSTSAIVTNGPQVLAGMQVMMPVAPVFSDPRFRSETVDAYEVGLKAKFLDNALTVNLAGFHEEFKDFQVLEFTGTQFRTFNVPNVTTTGFELETVARPIDQLTINASLTYADAKYPDDCAGTQTFLSVLNLCGNDLTNAPKIVAIAGATYRDRITDNLGFFLNGQIRMESDSRTSTQARNVPMNPALIGTTPLLPFDIQDGHIKINLRAGLGDPEKKWALEAWVTNLTNEQTRGVTINTPLRSGSRSAFLSEPRMYGLTLRSEF